MCHGLLALAVREHFLLTHHKTCWIMILDNVGLEIGVLGTQTSWSLLHFFFPQCKLKWSRDEFNGQSHISVISLLQIVLYFNISRDAL